MNILKQAARAVRREFLAGDLLTVFAALVLGVAVMTAVGTLVDRVTLALTSSAAEVLGGDLGVTGRQEIPASFADEAQRRGLQTTRLVSFPSVLFHGESSQMANIRGVGAGYPCAASCWYPRTRPARKRRHLRHRRRDRPMPIRACSTRWACALVNSWNSAPAISPSPACCVPNPTPPAS